MIVGVLALLVVLGGVTYAFFSATDTEEAKQITTAKEELDVKIEGSTHVSNIKPTNEFVVFGSSVNGPPKKYKNKIDIAQIPINVTNKSSIDINYNLTLQAKNLNLNSDDSLTGGTTEDIKWVLYKLNKKGGDSPSPESYGDFYDVDFINKMVTEISISPDETHYYLLCIYIEETNSNQNKLQNISFDVEIGGDTKSLDIVGKKLADVILDNSVIKNREPNYNLVEYEENGNIKFELQDIGLFKLNGKNIYYNRGPVYFNSYAFFGTYKSGDYEGYPILWKILRINEDKSITLLYNGDDALQSNYNSNGKSDYIGSEAETFVNDWYDNTFSEKEKALIQETTFCNDKSDNYEGAKNRLTKDIPEPTLDCREEDKVPSKIGLVIADELIYMGAVYNVSNKWNVSSKYGSLLIQLPCSSIYTMTPLSENTIFPNSCNGLEIRSDIETNYSRNLTPVITLSSESVISEGITYDEEFYKSMGTGNNPYYINAEEQ